MPSKIMLLVQYEITSELTQEQAQNLELIALTVKRLMFESALPKNIDLEFTNVLVKLKLHTTQAWPSGSQSYDERGDPEVTKRP